MDLLRSQWIRSFFIFLSVEILFILFIDDLTARLILLLQQYVSAGTLYYFAYKKQGTKWLLFFLISSPLGQIKEFLHLKDNTDILSAIFFLIEFVLVTYFWIYSFRLWGVNRLAKKQMSKNEIVSSSNLEERSTD